jgi:hypothetical protein
LLNKRTLSSGNHPLFSILNPCVPFGTAKIDKKVLNQKKSENIYNKKGARIANSLFISQIFFLVLTRTAVFYSHQGLFQETQKDSKVKSPLKFYIKGLSILYG